MAVIDEIGTGLLPTVYVSNTDLTVTSGHVMFRPTLTIKDSIDDGKFYWTNTIIQEYATITFLCVTNNFDGVNTEIISDLNNGIVTPVSVMGNAGDLAMDGVKIEKYTKPLSAFVLNEDNKHETDGEIVYDVSSTMPIISIGKENLDQIYVYVCMHIDLNDFAANIGVDADFGDIDYFSSLISSEKLIYHNGKWRHLKKINGKWKFINK